VKKKGGPSHRKARSKGTQRELGLSERKGTEFSARKNTSSRSKARGHQPRKRGLSAKSSPKGQKNREWLRGSKKRKVRGPTCVKIGPGPEKKYKGRTTKGRRAREKKSTKVDSGRERGGASHREWGDFVSGRKPRPGQISEREKNALSAGGGKKVSISYRNQEGGG